MRKRRTGTGKRRKNSEKEFFPMAVKKTTRYTNDEYTQYQPDPEKTPGLAEAY